MSEPLDNPIWHALIGPHARFAIGRGDARRYSPEVSPLAAIKEPTAAAYADLAEDLPLDQDALLFRPVDEALPPGWESILAKPIEQMILPPGTELPAARPAEARALPLSMPDASDMLELVELTKPGPFAPRTVELGGYVGVRDTNGRLIAMAGERLTVPGYAELSAVCVHPAAQGQGLGLATTLVVARAIIARGEVPFLHVWPENPARDLYGKIGLRLRTTLWVLLRRRTR